MLLRKYWVLIVFCIASGSKLSTAQCYFHKLYNNQDFYDGAFSITEATNQDLIFSGVSADLNGGTNEGYLVRLNSCGDTLWTKTWEYSPLGGDNGNHVTELPDGGILVAGAVYDASEGAANSFLYKFSAQGDSLWYRQYDLGYNDQTHHAEPVENGLFVLAGSVMDSTSQITNMFLAKCDTFGNVVWYHEYGDVNHEFFETFSIAADGAYIVSGTYQNNATSSYDMFMLKTDTAGNELWFESYGDNTYQSGGAVALTNDNGFILCGSTKNGDGNYKGMLVKTDEFGTEQWQREIDHTQNLDHLMRVFALPDGGYIAGGASQDYDASGTVMRVWLLRFTDTGDTIWTRRYSYHGGDTEDWLLDMDLTTEGGFVMTGYIMANQFASKNDAFVIRVDSLGCGTSVCTTGIEESPVNSMAKVYPNPIVDIGTIDVRVQRGKMSYISCYDYSGRMVREFSVTNNEKITIERGDEPAGIYFFVVRDATREIIATGKFILSD